MCKKEESGSCIEGRCLALATALTALARTLAVSGVLDRELFRRELQTAQAWLVQHGQQCAADSMGELLPNLMDV